ncbi:hypothetical protein KI688_008981 [Linnemannia hyalina]|uniref:PiggyBac transposable element-derived protein domain-containing protein n=1 Tax=Linnemannia hyalina TaxID=64524 RepID=A0A9P7Y1A7_9FUNG|nr:hypothetical protein KI688_008981 [Linnemannia hyalina]
MSVPSTNNFDDDDDDRPFTITRTTADTDNNDNNSKNEEEEQRVTTSAPDIAVNTNAYATKKDAGKSGSCVWTPVTKHELRIFLDIIIYMGVFGKNITHDYWSASEKYPQHSISKYMSLYRFQQIKRYLHVSPLNDDHVD